MGLACVLKRQTIKDFKMCQTGIANNTSFPLFAGCRVLLSAVPLPALLGKLAAVLCGLCCPGQLSTKSPFLTQRPGGSEPPSVQPSLTNNSNAVFTIGERLQPSLAAEHCLLPAVSREGREMPRCSSYSKV